MTKKKAENPWLSLAFNLIIPFQILSKLSSPERLGPEYALLAALFFPLVYTLYDFVVRRKFSWIAAIGFLGILMKGGLGLYKVSHFWFAVNEAAIPSLIGVVLLVSVLLGKPLVGVLLLNDALFDMEKINREIAANNAQIPFANALKTATYQVIVSFAISAVLNYWLAIYLLKSPVGSEEFNKELGYMTAVSMPIIMVCCSSIMVLALWLLIKKIQVLTGLDFEAMSHSQTPKKQKTPTATRDQV